MFPEGHSGIAERQLKGSKRWAAFQGEAKMAGTLPFGKKGRNMGEV